MMKRNRPALVFSPTGRHAGVQRESDVFGRRPAAHAIRPRTLAELAGRWRRSQLRSGSRPIQGHADPGNGDSGSGRVRAGPRRRGSDARRSGPNALREIVDRMRTAIDDGKPGGKGLWCLSILDNGIGLDQQTHDRDPR